MVLAFQLIGELNSKNIRVLGPAVNFFSLPWNFFILCLYGGFCLAWHKGLCIRFEEQREPLCGGGFSVNLICLFESASECEVAILALYMHTSSITLMLCA